MSEVIRPAEDHSGSQIARLVADMGEPHDRLSFDELMVQYNFQRTSCWQRTFVRLLADEADRARERSGEVHALDIGCGLGIGRRPQWTAAVRPHFDRLTGVEPDPSIRPNTTVLDSFQNATLEAADLPASHFDIAYSFMVVEHVADPAAFLQAIYRALKPGGVHFFATVNGNHYFAKIAKWMRRTGLEDAVLRLVRRQEETEAYHYPVEYRMNRPQQLESLAEAHGFDRPEFVFIEERGPEPYFPGPLKPVLKALMLKRRWIRRPDRLLTMYCRMQKCG
jgi:SAM-dependent methyltransferase